MIISVPATSANMGPGFDVLGIAIDLRNVVEVKPSRFFSLSIKGEGENNPKFKGNNIFVNIFYEHYKNLTGKKHNFRFSFSNNIPISRGLGSSSAVIVGAICAAYEAAGVSISKQKILDMALFYESHPDNISSAVMGGFNVAVVENGKVYAQKKVMPDYLKAVVVIPDRPISTAHSRTRLPHHYAREDAVFNLSRSSMLVAAILSERWDLLKLASKDRFHQNIRMKEMPILFEVQKKALENGAIMSTLSGSGSTFFNMAFEDDAPRLEGILRREFPKFRVKTLSFDNDGLRYQE